MEAWATPNAKGTNCRRVRAVTRVVVTLYIAACLLPCIDGGPESVPDPAFPSFEDGWQFGLEILFVGWCGDNNCVPWSANVVLALGLLCLWSRSFRPAMVLGLTASTLGLTTQWARPYDRLMVGYYVWQASLFALAVGASWALWRSRAGQARPPADEPRE